MNSLPKGLCEAARTIFQSHDEPIAIKLAVSNYRISRVLAGARSSIDVMFYDYFLKLGLHKKDLP